MAVEIMAEANVVEEEMVAVAAVVVRQQEVVMEGAQGSGPVSDAEQRVERRAARARRGRPPGEERGRADAALPVTQLAAL